MNVVVCLHIICHRQVVEVDGPKEREKEKERETLDQKGKFFPQTVPKVVGQILTTTCVCSFIDRAS